MSIALNRPIFDAVARVTGFRGEHVHAPQEAFIDALFGGARFATCVWGRRGGKTALLGDGLHPYVAIQPDKQVWVVSKTYALAGKVGAYMVKALRRVMTEGVDYRLSNPSSNQLKIRTRWGTVIELKSADHPDSLIGEGNDLIIFDEAATVKRRIWQQYLEPTLIDRKGQAVFITTPRGHNWIYDMFERGQSDDPLYWSSRAPSSANPYLDGDELARAKRDTDPQVWRQEYMAEFVSFANQVYASFEREKHVIPKPDLKYWTVSVAADPGYANACALLWIAHNEESGEDIIFDEHIEPNMEYPDVARVLNDRCPPEGYDLCVSDVAGRARTQAGPGFIAAMKQYGYRFRSRGGIGIYDSVNVVRSRLLNVDGDRKLFVTPNCRKTIQAFEGYHYPERTGEQWEEPEKDGVFDHPMDALRYYTVYRYSGNQARSWIA